MYAFLHSAKEGDTVIRVRDDKRRYSLERVVKVTPRLIYTSPSVFYSREGDCRSAHKPGRLINPTAENIAKVEAAQAERERAELEAENARTRARLESTRKRRTWAADTLSQLDAIPRNNKDDRIEALLARAEAFFDLRMDLPL